MHVDIAVYVDEYGKTASLHDQGKMVLYRKSRGKWNVVYEKDFFPGNGPGIKELREKMGEMLAFLGDCRVVAGLSVVGVPYFELEKMNFSIWEIDGKPQEFLDYILEKEEEAREEKPGAAENGFRPQPLETSPGCYRVSIKEIQENNLGITSKQILLPFLRGGGFYSLEIICSHVPPWLQAEMTGGSLDGEIKRIEDNLIMVVIKKRLCN